ncbi:hypothetical protein ABB37_05473 [Leptomonas pyrrhocoris]|uniref:Uncharacterized protein n=1 Tax=Leptomonas pyrrhocoris TaxID=157538 RepID=A0A0N0VF43_LEPPY|nr:hypothetical protein ABB37_05473 [Leptomonas pyrrhocoris]XP_015658148.1 hypothetical protein ABB37_05473 [Leptomonas pyrrhocoris]XP_015658149.1 hypothetical protein ABB37_05473 [Leptomonas pyrrhocoris]KPA79708.1 hypothetical protein ABB37_05473 [Leptomonas pyrrhocoris]KPA79709.1 hypothetical protein ABB37_05473 [Leptomonas pyrrhocoris]KPA79710.1 hypothetical protein ABB37_05473 [Leptomonas pyrrhocoris]|eukprot:XP_015658147.1 hypothetical protein ABB37_05473 [Leptomonas pyrrhocoris]
MGETVTKVSGAAALKLQRERSSTYQQWTSQFHRALAGAITPDELHRNIQGVVLPELQRVSTALRALQRSLTEQMGGDGVPNPATASAAENRVADNQHSRERNLAEWIDQLQSLEREHYGVTLALASQLVDHCTPNVLSALPLTGEKEEMQSQGLPAKATELSGEVVPADVKSLFKPEDSEDEDSNEEIEWRGKRPAGPPPAPAPAAEADAAEKQTAVPATLCVHDGGRCALLRLIPPLFQTHLFFVDCKEGVDELGGASSSSSASLSPHDGDDGAESLALPVYGKRESGRAAGNGQRGTPIAYYVPSVVSHRCVGWSRTVEPIVRRQDALRTAIEDMCEELQNEVSDL